MRFQGFLSITPTSGPFLRGSGIGVLGDIILFIVAPTAPSSSDVSSDQSGYGSSYHNEPDLDNFDPDFPEDGYWRS
jgi:hypothetical protein